MKSGTQSKAALSVNTASTETKPEEFKKKRSTSFNLGARKLIKVKPASEKPRFEDDQPTPDEQRKTSHSSISVPGNPATIIEILRTELDWFGKQWDDEPLEKRQKIFEIIARGEPPVNSNEELPLPVPANIQASPTPKFWRPGRKVVFPKSPSANADIKPIPPPQTPEQTFMVLNVIELAQQTKIFLSNCVNVSNGEQEIESLQPLLAITRDALKTLLLKCCHQFSAYPFCQAPFDAIVTETKSLPSVDETLRQGILQEVPVMISLIGYSIKRSVCGDMEQIRSTLSAISETILQDAALSEAEELLLLLLAHLLNQTLESLVKNITALIYSNSVRDSKSKSSRYIPRVKLQSAEELALDREQWPPGGCTLDSLIFDLTSGGKYDNRLLKAFISTYHAYASPYELLCKLLGRFHSANSDAVRLQVCIVIKYWMETQISDFQDQLLSQVTNFIDKSVHAHHTEMAVLLKRILDNQVKIVLSHQSSRVEMLPYFVNTDTVSPQGPINCFLNATPAEIARQLTLIDWELFSSIEMLGLLQVAWEKTKLQHRAIPVTRYMNRINSLSRWTASFILIHPQPSVRCEILKKFLLVATELQKLNNYNSLGGIIVGINLSAISRLKQTKGLLGKKYVKIWEDFDNLIIPSGSYKNYRAAVKNLVPPLIPYFTVYLSDLAFIDEGNPDILSCGLINFAKQELVYGSLQEIILYQQHGYEIERKDPLCSTLTALPYLDEQALYGLSLHREARAPKQT